MSAVYRATKMQYIPAIFLLVTAIFLSREALSHDLFVSIQENVAHSPDRYGVTVGWGHNMPLDDFIRADIMDSYAVHSPSNIRMDFKFDVNANKGIYLKKAPGRKEYKDLTMQMGYHFAEHILFNKNSPKGTYQVGIVTKHYPYTVWIDKNGDRQTSDEKYKDQIKDAKQIIRSTSYVWSGKSFIARDKWTKPKPIGHELEIIPFSDLSQVKAGDEVTFDVLFNGKPLSSTSDNRKYLEASSQTFGKPGEYAIFGYINKGKSTIKVTTPGQWIVKVYKVENVTKNSKYKNLSGKADTVVFVATATFHVQ